MAKLIFYLFLFLSYVAFSNAINPSAYVPPSVILNNKYFVEIEQEIRVGFRLFDVSSLNNDSKTINYRNLQYATDSPRILVPRVVANKNKLFFFGTNGHDILETTLMFSFDINEGTWNELKDVNMPSHIYPYQEENFVGPDSEGNAYLLYNDNNIMLSFNTETLKWSQYSIQSFVPTDYAYYSWYTATILPDGNIAYIGGKFSNGTSFVDALMNQFYIYDTKIHVWSAKSTLGTTPGPRNGHSASLTSDGSRIIVYGGMNANGQPSNPSLAVLNINNSEWSSPQVTNPIGSVWLTPSVIIDNYMFLYVGINITTSVQNAFDKVFMLDTSTYTWNTLDPVAYNSNENIFGNGKNQLADARPDTNRSDDLTVTLMIILIVIGSILILMIFAFTFYKLYQTRRHKVGQQKVIMDHSHNQPQSQV
uniref:Rab9 effector protein with kelch motifs n=1 Tax=Anthurium amnicola TaxID=1678845 RepID=A0A1D1YEE7_9ARAE